jgi:hypothetical protein
VDKFDRLFPPKIPGTWRGKIGATLCRRFPFSVYFRKNGSNVFSLWSFVDILAERDLCSWSRVMKKSFKTTVLAAAMALTTVAIGSASVSAATITPTSATVGSGDVGTSWTVDFICSSALPCNGGDPLVNLGARAIMTLTGYTIDGDNIVWDVQMVIRNTSFLNAGGFLTALGFATDPDAVLSDVWDANADGINWAGGDGSIPGFGNTELCVYDGNNCAAANNHLMTPATQDRFGFSLTTALVNTLSFTDFAVKWAGTAVTGISYESGGTISVAPVPLPAAGGLLLAGLAGLAALRRKQKAA